MRVKNIVFNASPLIFAFQLVDSRLVDDKN